MPPDSLSSRREADTPIADYGLLSDCHTAALVSRDGSIDWFCLPRFDSPSVFGRLLDPKAGHWSIHPVGAYEVDREYVEDSLVLRTRFTTAQGVLVLTDALVLDRHNRGHDVGVDAPHVLVRSVEVTEGWVDVTAELRPRPEYGLVQPRLTAADGTLHCQGGAEVLTLAGPGPDDVREGTARWRVAVSAGESLIFALHHRRRAEDPVDPWSARQAGKYLAGTVKAWNTWSELHQSYTGPAEKLVRHSGRILQAMTYQPTGAIVAAVTTSLPEAVGGDRNWDYRYAWIRDASFTLNALWVAACPEEAGHFLHWLIDTAGSSLGAERPRDAAGIQIMYGVGGEHDLAERELEHLAGWRGSQPVRVGNGAWAQRQIDIYGELLDSVARLRPQLHDRPSELTCGFLVAIADAAAEAWTEPDSGIWEQRGDPRHYLYSKLMCWVALDRAVGLADWLQAPERAEGWRAEAERIRSAILERGWSEKRAAYAQSFGDDTLDAAALMLCITGMVAPDDPRMVSTVRKVAAELTTPEGFVLRYEGGDGFEGQEGAFLLCSYWLVECLAAMGDVAEAERLFEQCNRLANDLGLLSEQVDSASGELLGNFPQAFSHVGLVNAGWALAQAGERSDPGTPHDRNA